MIRLVLSCLLIAGNAAMAQQPRVTLDVELAGSPGFAPDRYAPSGLLATSDAGFFVALKQLDPTGKQVKVELVALDRAGAPRFRTELPVDINRPAIDSLGVVVATSGDIGVAVSLQDGEPDPLMLVRLAADGRLKKRAEIGPPYRRKDTTGFVYSLEHHLPTADGAVMLAGGWGGGPYAWWLGKFSLDGVRIFQAGPGSGFPERVGAIAQRADGHWLALVQEMRQPGGGLDWHLHKYAADGRRQSNLRLPLGESYGAAVLSEGAVIVNDGHLVYFDDAGRLSRRVAWPFTGTSQLVAGGTGFWAVVTEGTNSDAPNYVVHVDGQGQVRWRSAPLEARGLARTPEGQLAAVVYDKDRASLRLMRFADP